MTVKTLQATATQPYDDLNSSVTAVVMSQNGDVQAKQSLAHRIEEGLHPEEPSDIAATTSFLSLITALCEQGEIVAVA